MLLMFGLQVGLSFVEVHAGRTELASNEKSGPQYFGFYANGAVGWGDRIDQTKDYSNLNWLEVHDVSVLLEQLERTKKYGQKAILIVPDVFFEWPSTARKADGEAKFRVLYEQLSAYHEQIVAFLVADEPYRHNKKRVHLPDDQVNDNLNSVCRFLKAETGKATVVSVAGTEITRWGVPRDADWIGFYQYSYNTTRIALGYYWTRLLLALHPHQKIMAVVDAYENPGAPINEGRINRHNEVFRRLVSLNSDRVIAVAPFVYQTVPDVLQGVDQMPRVLNDLKAWGFEITGRKSP